MGTLCGHNLAEMTHVGFAMARNNAWIYVVARYSPAGNMVGCSGYTGYTGIEGYVNTGC